MALSRTARLGAGGLVLVTCGVLAACGFTPFGTEPGADDVEAGVGAAGDGGSAGEAAADADGTAPDGSPIPCPSGCTSCTGSTCNILCDVTHPCPTPITCPPGVPCHVTCDAADVCSQRTISCANASSCLVDCTRTHACQTMGVDCGNGACRVDCTNFASACVAVNLNAANAASLCLQCDAINGSPGCMGTDAKKPTAGRPCDLVCTGGGCNANGNGLNGCASTSICP